MILQKNLSVELKTYCRIGVPLVESNLASSCNANCSCQQEFFLPSCGADNMTYFSPCHAGCTVESVNNVTGDKVMIQIIIVYFFKSGKKS